MADGRHLTGDAARAAAATTAEMLARDGRVARYWDFKPFLETQWRYAGERLRERRRGAQP